MKKVIMGEIFFIILCVAGIVHLHFENQELRERISSIDAAIKGDELIQKNIHSLEKIIQGSITDYVEEQKKKKVQEKYSDYGNAAPGPKRIYGDPKAPFTIVTYSDLECPVCKEFHQTPKSVVDRSAGKINWEFKHFPLPMHNPVAAIEAMAAECVSEISGNTAFWVYLDDIFKSTRGGGQGVTSLTNIVSELGIDKIEFDECMKNDTLRKQMIASIQKGVDLNINSTPTSFVVNNKTGEYLVLDGLVGAGDLHQAVDQLLKQQEQALRSVTNSAPHG